MNTIAWITSKNEQYDIKDIEARKTKLNIEDLPKNLSAFSNDVGFIDNTVNNLINYYKKSETYTKTEIDQKLSAKWDSKFVDELPTEDISTTTIYFLKRKKEQGTTQYESDVYDEYIYTGTWELIGNTYVDLTDYYRKSEVEEVIDSKVLVETNNRITSENEIKNNIENVNNYAKSIENNLNSEISTRQNNDLLHDTKINEVESNLNSEISRAKSAENTLSNRCDTYDSHIANSDNPHNVTKSQIGLGNVTNVSTTDTITLNSENNITSGAVYTALENKVDKVSGKGLSDQNFTLAEKTKLSGLKNYDDTSISNRVTATENAITTLNGNSSVSGSVDKKIADAIAGITQLDFKIVSSLPSTGIKGTIYLIRGTGTETTQQYDEYIWVNSKWEQLGKSTIEVDLSDVYSKSEVNALVSVKNDKITITDDNSTAITDADTFSTTSNSGTNPTNLTKRPLSLLWNYIKGKADSIYAVLSHKHSASDITSGTLPVANGGTGATDAKDGFTNLANGLTQAYNPQDTEYMIYKSSGGWGLYTLFHFWEYIKGKISSVLGLTATQYNGNANTANKIEPNYTTSVELSEVTSETTKYIKIAECSWQQSGTLQVYLSGNAIVDTLVINFGGGNATTPMLCGYYHGHNYKISSVIAQKGSSYSSDYLIYVKIRQQTNCGVHVALLKGDCTINITESTTAPTNISEWPVNYGLFGTLTGNSSKSSFLDEYVGAGGTRLTSGNIVPKDSSEWGGMRIDVVTDSMTDGSHPGQDGHLLTMFWDNAGKYDSQFFVSNAVPQTVKVRTKANRADDCPWTDIITSNNIGSQSVASARNAYSGMVYTCQTASATREKTVSIPGFTLTSGACIRVKFLYGNNAKFPTLNVNNTSAYQILGSRGSLQTLIESASDISVQSGLGVCSWDTNIVLDLYFDGTNWEIIGDPIVKKFYDRTNALHKNVSLIGNVQTSILW